KSLWELIEAAGKDSGVQRRRASLIVRLLVDGFRQALARSLGGPPPTDPVDTPLIEQLAERLGPDGLLPRLERCLEADVQIERRVQLILVVEALVDALVYG